MKNSVSIKPLSTIAQATPVRQLSYAGAVHIWKVGFAIDRERKSMRALAKPFIAEILKKHYSFPLASEFVFSEQANGKPELSIAGLRPLHFNRSYTKGTMVLAISDQPIGIDVEKIDPNFDYLEIIHAYFSKDEVSSLQSENHAHFFLLWTRKEAILKATGIGLVEELQSVPSLDGNHTLPVEITGAAPFDWQLHSFNLSDMLLSLATPYSWDAIKLFNLTS